MTLPDQAGPLAFPLVQRCQTGSLDWIEETVAGQPEPEHPAPVLQVTAGPTTSTTLPETSTTTSTTSTTSTTTTAPTTTTIAPDPSSGDDDDDSNALPYVLGGVAAAIVIGGAGYALVRSQRRHG